VELHTQALPIPAQTAEVEPSIDIDGCSVSSEFECPVCYQLYCEPVKAGCDRHVFCRNCLLKSQRVGRILKCPICRAESQQNVAELVEAADVVDKIKQKDPSYDDRVAAARKEREELIQMRLVRMMSLADSRASRQFEVCGAGSQEVSGVYLTGHLPTYVGPTVYRKPNTFMFIFRWHQTQWCIAELHTPSNMGNEREWLYRAPTQYPPDIPPAHGWEVPATSRAANPPPEVRILHSLGSLDPGNPAFASPTADRTVLHTTIVRRRSRGPGVPVTSSGGLSLQDSAWPHNSLEGEQVRCRCGPSCCVM